MRKDRLLAFLTFFILKALCTVVVIAFYMGSQISTENTPPSVMMAMMMMSHRDDDSGGKIESIAMDAGVVVGSNSTKIRGDDYVNDKTNGSSSSEGGRMITPNLSDGTLQGKERLWAMLRTRNVTTVDSNYWSTIPPWETIVRNIRRRRASRGDDDGDDDGPIIHGLDTCESFRNKTSSDPSQRRIAPGGMFNTGTNYLSVLLEYNCQNPSRVAKFHGKAKRGHGNEWEVPWGKHTPASMRGSYTKYNHTKYTIDEVLPVVLIRNPYGWMKSMCRHPYTATWNGMHEDEATCPRLKLSEGGGEEEVGGKDDIGGGGGYVPVDVKYGSGTSRYRSLGHLWNDWYGEYFYGDNERNSTRDTRAPFPRLIIRFEDVIFYPYEVTRQVCECAGGVLGHREDDKDVPDDGTFHYVVRSAKTGPAHGPASQRNGLMDSWAKYGSGNPKDEYSVEGIRIAMDILDPLLLETFGYG
ncbi:hypothetical protein ACHAXA_003482 [Cyclostephanos tholiformis]|uniref:Sulfotransferase n=1 Tax=Cyclostephanos tholiformis TaxID=382380 RepID=A0ABD3SFP2_9STRA